MKIIDLSSYEKLKIRPVSVGNLDGGIDLSLEKVDLMKQSYWTIEPGWIVKIRWKKINLDGFRFREFNQIVR